MKELPGKLKFFLVSLYIFAIGTVGIMIYKGVVPISIPSYIDVVFFAAFLALTESFMVQYKNLAISAAFVVNLAAILLFKPLAAVIIFILGFTFRVIKVNGKYIHIINTPIYKTLYNYCTIVISIIYSGLIYNIIGGNFDPLHPWSNFHLCLLLSISYFIVNTLITSILFSLLNNKSVFYFLKSNIRLGLLSTVAMAPFGIILAYVYNKYKFGGVLLVLLPIVISKYTFSLYFETKNQYVQTVDTLMRAMEARDKYTEGHSQRVAEIAKSIAEELKYSESKIERLTIASLLHDVGKIGIDDSILNKPGRLTQEEYEIIKSHPEIGYNILKDLSNLEDILPIIRHHHERFDGKGYPDGKNSDNLTLDVFIVQLADTIDAMATDRPYRRALPEGKIYDEIVTYSGTQFHPTVVEAYLKVLEKQKKVV